MSSRSGLTRAVPIAGACILLTSRINVSFVALRFWSHMGMLQVGQGSGLGFSSVSLRFTDCSDGLPSICAGTRMASIVLAKELAEEHWCDFRLALYCTLLHGFHVLDMFFVMLKKNWYIFETQYRFSGSFIRGGSHLRPDTLETRHKPRSSKLL